MDPVALPDQQFQLHRMIGIKFQPIPDRLKAANGSAWKVELKRDVRNAILVPPGHSVERELLVPDDASFHFLCRDRGIGIPEQEQEKIFEKFHQVDSSATRHYGGAGLGLSIVKEIVALHGGKVWAESEPGGGCTFHFTLPKTGAPDGSDPGDSSRTLPRAELT